MQTSHSGWTMNKCMTKRHWPLEILEDCALVGSLINHDHNSIQAKIPALHRITMRPRILVNVREIDMTTILDQNKCVYTVQYCICMIYVWYVRIYTYIIYIFIESQLTTDRSMEKTCFRLCWIIEFLQSPYVWQWKSWPTSTVFRASFVCVRR